MSSFEFLFLGWLFASQKTDFSGFRYRFIPSLRFGTGYASPYNPCHGLKIKHPKLNLLDTNQNLLTPFKIHLQFKIQKKIVKKV
ncbi:MAG: hypothetical protein MR739_10730 [Spirochaetia bacterium]|nr:hypothetical protein [Spirochaetia bacterium]